MQYFAFFYDYPATSEAIVQARPEHRAYLSELKEAGILVGSGPFLDDDGGALVVIRVPEEQGIDAAREIMGKDPFQARGLLDGVTVRPWNPVLNIFPG